jgi:hypothetical protein
MLHGAIFLATCNAILLLRDVKLPNTSFHYTPLMFSQHIENSSQILLYLTSLKSRIALQVARKIAPCNMAFRFKTSIFLDIKCRAINCFSIDALSRLITKRCFPNSRLNYVYIQMIQYYSIKLYNLISLSLWTHKNRPKFRGLSPEFQIYRRVQRVTLNFPTLEFLTNRLNLRCYKFLCWLIFCHFLSIPIK